MVFGVLALVALLVFGYRVYREPRRLGNAVWLGIAAVFGALWLLLVLADVRSLRDVLVWVAVVVGLLVVLVLPLALIANGVVMWRREGHRLANLLSLLAGVGALGVVGVTVLALALGGSPWLVAAATSVSLVAGYLAFLFLALVAYSAIYSTLGKRVEADAIIVLGAGLRGDKVPPLLRARLDRAVQCREHGADAVVVVSGGRGADELVSEAEAMSGYLLERGVPSDRVVLEDQATTTEQNLLYSTALLTEQGHTGKTVVVTNNYHVFRTAVLSRRLRLRLTVVGARTASYFVPSAFLREFVALLVFYRKTNLVLLLVLAGGPLVLAALATR
ncbi:YdcF family protein [Actinokineospora diospyrosa]|uniref:Uncharacterized SAM-binding protein YcdF, DUF218 family n=1 Tax=Actinokineospora diospyrosa TaxID=103728 RepID=A0ABT1IG75_9PSEU|nr:YdcF family protein [Actinokineospora diospyrosa]MCP2271551.1 Uncharacterized SAM-binding protein YcdF, DUF218 family [Actinokineospora diospyrosa]